MSAPFDRRYCLAAVLAAPAAALDLALPEGATIVAATPPGAGTHRHRHRHMGRQPRAHCDVSGTVRAATWQIPARRGSLACRRHAGIEQQLRRAGLPDRPDVRRYGLRRLRFPPSLDMGQSPEMHVDIGNFRYLAARHEAEGEAVAVTVSQGGSDVLRPRGACRRRQPAMDLGHTVEPRADHWNRRRRHPTGGATERQAIARLAESGAVPLDDLRFRTGASELSGNDYPSLARSPPSLPKNPGRRVVLVGHTDAEGGRESNIALSEARAEAVRRHLIDTCWA
jgi:outer membrane protein OmpA-like peptidoglycan-associated protein